MHHAISIIHDFRECLGLRQVLVPRACPTLHKMDELVDVNAHRMILKSILTLLLVASSKCVDAACTGSRTDVILVLDESGSIDPADFDEMIDYVTSNLIPNALGPNSDLRVGAIGYSENVDKIYDLNDAPTDGNRGPLISAIRSNAKESLTTDTYAALDEAIKMFKSAKNPVKASNRYVILFTDGVPDTDNLCQGGTPNSQLGITDETILTVAIGTFSRDALECFFGNNDKNLFEVQDFDLLDDKLTKAIENEVCLPPETPELGLWDKIKQTCNCGKFKKGDTCPKDAIYARFPKANVRFVRRMMRRYRRYCRPYGL